MSSSLPSPTGFKNHKASLHPAVRSSSHTEGISLEQVANEFNHFEPLSKRHTEHLLALYPEWMYDSADDADLEYFSSMVRYDRKANSLVAAILDNHPLSVGIVSYKWRYKNGVKWRTRAGTHPNSTVMYRIWSDDIPIFVVEGIRDFMAGVLLGWNIIGIPTAGYRGHLSNIRRDERVIFFIEDKAAYNTMTRLAGEISSITENISLILPQDTKQDISDICFQCKDREEVENEIFKNSKRS